MPGRKKGQTSIGKARANKSNNQNPALDSGRTENNPAIPAEDIPVASVFVPEEEPQPDDWAEFFADEQDGNVIVQLQRISPDIVIQDAETGAEIRTAGYCEDLPSGLTSYRAYIKHRYGGGTYRVQKRVAGRITKQRYEHIQGKPILDQPVPETSVVEPLPSEHVDGVDIGGTDDQWMKRMERLLSMKKILEPSAPTPAIDHNLLRTLLNVIIEQKTPDPVAQVQMMASLISSVKELIPDQSSGASMTDILNTGLKTVGQLLISSPRRTLPIGSTPVLDRPQVGNNVDMSSVSNDQQITKERIDQMSQAPQIRELAGLAIQTIVTCFRLEPPKPAERVVPMLDSSLGMTKEQRSDLLTYKQVLFDLAEAQLEEDFSSESQKRPEFKSYFEAIFSEFVRADREVLTL